MGLKQQVRYMEKQHLRPFIRRIKGMIPTLGGRPSIPPQLQARLEALEARVAELEHLIQEDLGLRLAEPAPTPQKPDGNA